MPEFLPNEPTQPSHTYTHTMEEAIQAVIQGAGSGGNQWSNNREKREDRVNVRARDNLSPTKDLHHYLLPKMKASNEFDNAEKEASNVIW